MLVLKWMKDNWPNIPEGHALFGFSKLCSRWTAFLLAVLVHSVSSQSVCHQHKLVFTSNFTGNITDGPRDYKSDQRCEWLILSPDAEKYPFITLKFLSKKTECTYDYVMVHDGDSYDSPRLATLSGDYTNGPFHQVVAESGKMLVYLFSDINTTFEGFEASFSISECPNNCSGHGECRLNSCYCEDAWTGKDCSQSACPYSCEDVLHGHCRTETESKKCNCEKGFIGIGCGMSTSLSEDGGWWTMVYDYMGEPGSGGRAGHAGVFIHPHYYIFGGYDLNQPLAELLRYNFQANEWLLMRFSNQPSPRFFHSLTDLGENTDNNGHSLLLFGGDLGSDMLSDETWIFDTWDSTWYMHSPLSWHSPPPHLCQHAASFVQIGSDRYVYIHGGRSFDTPDEGLSSEMYRFDWKDKLWQQVKYDPSGVRTSNLRVAGHTILYDELDHSLVLFGGFRMDDLQRAVYSSAVFLYSVAENRWAEIKESPAHNYYIEPLSFHTANVVGDFMIVHGGNMNSNLCFNSKTYFYNLRCHAWIPDMTNLAPRNRGFFRGGRYSHTAAVINNNILLIHGGYNGAVSNNLLAYKLPRLHSPSTAEEARKICDIYKTEKSCNADQVSGCVWQGINCASRTNIQPVCGSVCQSLKDCVSCTTFKSYMRNAQYEWESFPCGWCVQDSACYAVNGKDDTIVCKGRHASDGIDPWWSNNGTQLLKDARSCLLENVPPGLVAALYHPDPNFSYPDKVTHLHKILYEMRDQGGNLVLELQGFLRPRSFEGEHLLIKLLSTKGKAEFNMSTSQLPSASRSIVKTSQRDLKDENVSQEISLDSLREQRYYIRIRFAHVGDDSSWIGKLAAEWNSGYSGNGHKVFNYLMSDVLEPYQSAVLPASGTFPSCGAFSNCLACLTDMSCAWCESRGVCVRRSVLAARPYWCSLTGSTVVSDHVGMITEPASCTICSDYPTCMHCLAASSCEWQVDKCRRPDSSVNKTSDPALCPVPCHARTNCKSCLTSADPETGAKQHCAWCSTTQRCYKFKSYHLTAYPFGQCAFWVDKFEQCPDCTQHSNCESCLGSYECGWCSNLSNPLQGYCTKGAFAKPELDCDGGYFNPENITEMRWDYTACPDVDECVLEWPEGTKLHYCHEDALCVNTIGSYYCECNTGYKGDGFNCDRTCLVECVHGICSGAPDYRCLCDLGWTSGNGSSDDFYGDDGRAAECDVDCGCNMLSTCENGPGICDECQQNTTGPECGECLPGHSHRSGEGTGCQACQCNRHGIEELGICDQETGNCSCEHNTRGFYCEKCEAGYYGDPRNGGTCYRMCDGRTRMEVQEGAFGSWVRAKREEGSLLRREKDRVDVTIFNCEWQLMAATTTNTQTTIAIVIKKEINVPCFTNQVLVYDGVPGSDNGQLLGAFCGSGWDEDITVYALSGLATVRYADVFPLGGLVWTGFNATSSVISAPATTMQYMVDTENVIDELESSGGEMYSGAGAPVHNSTVLSAGKVADAVQCPENCSNHLGQGECIDGVCHCFKFYTGPGCATFEAGLNSSVHVQVAWDRMNGNVSGPAFLTGNVLVGFGGYVWAHGGHSPDDGTRDDLWRYEAFTSQWLLLYRASAPAGRHFHASAIHPANKGFYIHGGLLENGHTSSELWMFDGEAWQKIEVSKSLPALAGHSMTFCGGTKAYIIGGYDSNFGYSHNVWTFDSADSTVSLIHSKQIHPPSVYGHSTVCDSDNGCLYVYGGMKTSVFQPPVPTDSIHVFNVTEQKWRPVFKARSSHIAPSSRAFHTASPYTSDSMRGMLIFGGRLASGDTSDEIWLFVYECGTWIRLASGLDITADITAATAISAYTSLAVFADRMYIYGGIQHGRFTAKMIVISDIDPCRTAADDFECNNMKIGCKVCTYNDDVVCVSRKEDAANYSCVDAGVLEMEEACAGEVAPDCSSLRDCRSCVSVGESNGSGSHHHSCHWCHSQSNPVTDQGRCQPVGEECEEQDTSVVSRRSCNHCSAASCLTCSSKKLCVWKETEIMYQSYNKILKTYSCQSKSMPTDWNNYYTVASTSSDPTMQPAMPMFHDGHICPTGCGTHQTCESCLGFDDWHDKWRDCVWSPGLAQCIEPAYVPLLCPPGDGCGTLATKGPISCPVSSCASLRFCWECIGHPACGWLQSGTSSICLEGSSEKPHNKVISVANGTVVWWYHKCPPENECIEGFDDCLTDLDNREKCEDLDQGFSCTCQDGYARESPVYQCTPVCTAGCFEGVCIHPDVCECDFGFTGISCNISCQCNGHSDCQDGDHPNICLDCKHNTMGNQCESCIKSFVGDPTKNETCVPCKNVCMGRSENCTSKSNRNDDRGPTIDDVKCIECRGNSRGDRCDVCKDGYFMLDGECRLCECNGHSETCDHKTGGFCKCKNHTKTSDPKCDISSHDAYPSHCWNMQCDKCTDSYQGNPKNGGQCYKQVMMDHEMCFNPLSPSSCVATDYGSNGHNVNTIGGMNHILPEGQTILFALNPKYTNLNIRVMVDVTFGELSVFISDRPDAFFVKTDPVTRKHSVIPNKYSVDSMSDPSRLRRDLEMLHFSEPQSMVRGNDRFGRPDLKELFRMQRSHAGNRLVEEYLESLSETHDRSQRHEPANKPKEDPSSSPRTSGKAKEKLLLRRVNATDFNTFLDLPAKTALIVDKVQNRLVISIPHADYDLSTAKFYVILLGQLAQKQTPIGADTPAQGHGRGKRAAPSEDFSVDKAAGLLLFRQDQTHIDLFVFFSVFFSCFFLFLAVCIVTWKAKQVLDLRQARHARNIEMQYMASRPFACVYVTLLDYAPEPVLRPYRRENARNAPEEISQNRLTNSKLESTSQLFQARSCPVFAYCKGGCSIDDGAGTSGYSANAAMKTANSSSTPVSPYKPPQKSIAHKILSRRGIDRLSLDFSSHSAPQTNMEDCITPSETLDKNFSHSADFVACCNDQLLVFHGSDQSIGHRMPLLNSMAYIKEDTGGDNKLVPLTPISSSSSRTPSPLKSTTYIQPFTEGVPTMVSLESDGSILTVSKRKTLPPMPGRLREDVGGPSSSTRTKFCSTPNLPMGAVTNSIQNYSLTRQSSGGSQQTIPPNTISNVKSGQRSARSRFSYRGRSKERTKRQQKTCTNNSPGPVACEPTENGVASVNTVLLQLPGGVHAPVLACLGSSLITTRNMCYPSLNDATQVSKPRFKSRASKML